MASAELPKPGVEVIQQFSTTSPTIAAPRLVPCVIGVCRQIIEVTNSDGTINSDAAVSAPAVANADLVENYNLNGTTISLQVDGGATQTNTIVSTNPSTAAAAALAFNALTWTGVTAYVWVDTAGNNRLQLRTDGAGSARSIRFIGGTVGSILGWADAVGYTWYGTGTYIQDSIFLPSESFPDPRSNMADLTMETTSIAAYLNLGTSITQIPDDESFLNGDLGTGTAVISDDGDGDSLTPFIDLADAVGPVNFNAADAAAAVTGTGDISAIVYPSTAADLRMHNLALGLQIDGGGLQTVTITGMPIVSTNSAAGPGWTFPHNSTLNLLVNGQAVAVAINPGVEGVSIATIIAAINVATQAAVGVDVAYECAVTGLAAAGGYLGLFVGADPLVPVASSEVSVVSDVGAHAAEMFGAAALFQSCDKVGLGGVLPIQTQINNAMNETIATAPGNFLVLTSNTTGYESKIEIHPTPISSTQLLTSLGLTAASSYGTPFRLRVGDHLYADDALLGTITEIHPGGVSGRVKIGTEVLLSATYSSWYIIAQGLDSLTTSWGSTVPTPDFYVDTAGDAHIKHDFLRDSLGAPIGSTNVGLYLTYQAVRQDVSPAATTGTPAMVVFEDVDELEDAIGPITSSNPLAYGMFIAMSNAANVQISGIGVSAVSTSETNGTLVAFNEAFDFLETEEVYALALMTDDPLVHQAAKTHVDAMSAAAAKGERVAIICQDRPTRAMDTIAASGTDGEAFSATVYETNNPLLTTGLTAAGINPTSIAVTDGVYLDTESDSYRWNITGSVAGGTRVTVNKVFVAGQNDDNFYYSLPGADTLLTTLLVDETFSIKVRGAAIPATTAGRNTEVSTYVSIGQSYADRRVWFIVADGVYGSVDGVSVLLEGYYLTAAKAGMVAGNLPSQPMTNVALSGFTAVTGTNDRYSETQMNQIAYGGCDLIVQYGAGSPLVSRHQLTTNMTSIETREQSIVKAVDFCSKFIRTGLRNFIGKYNITETFLDTLSAVVQGQLRYLSDNGVLAGADLNNIIQDTTNPDTVLVDVTLEVLYPCNYIRVTLVI